jgi:uncharacterized protein YbjT (DUF2867 family)
MRVVVIGGTGLIGARLVRVLAARGHEPVAASRSTGVDVVTGEGLAEALAGAEVVVDVSNPSSYFRTSTAQLLKTAEQAGVRHVVALSVVGVDGLPDSGYMVSKAGQERQIEESGIPFTILRATQFHEFLGAVADGHTDGGVVRVPAALLQTVGADDVTATLADLVEAGPTGRVELAGPEAAPFATVLGRWLTARGDGRTVVEDPAAKYFGATVSGSSLVPTSGRERLGATSLDAWLAAG